MIAYPEANSQNGDEAQNNRIIREINSSGKYFEETLTWWLFLNI